MVDPPYIYRRMYVRLTQRASPRSRSSAIRWGLVIVLLTSLLMVEGRGEAGIMTFTSEDYAFTGPEQIESGWQTVRLINSGHEVHQIQFLGLPQGKTVKDVEQALAGRSPSLPNWVRRHGGVNSVTPDNEASVVINLDPGDYVLLCGIPDATGRPHVMRGMVRSFRVIASPSQAAAPPPSDTTLHMKDFSFSLDEPLRPGGRILHVRNEGTQAHEVVVIRLADGASTQDFLERYRPGGAPNSAGTEVGGVVGIDPGHDAYVHLDVEPGRYGLICFLADPVTRIPHFAHGMWMDVEVDPGAAPSEAP